LDGTISKNVGTGVGKVLGQGVAVLSLAKSQNWAFLSVKAAPETTDSDPHLHVFFFLSGAAFHIYRRMSPKAAAMRSTRPVIGGGYSRRFIRENGSRDDHEPIGMGVFANIQHKPTTAYWR
jgi:hypothetical protein